jgi:WXG100 family type VII secretion target
MQAGWGRTWSTRVNADLRVGNRWWALFGAATTTATPEERRGECAMAGSFRVDQDVMRTSSGDHAATAQDVQNTANTMIAELDSITWVGDGGTAFNQAKERLKEDLQAISSAMGGLAEKLGSATGKYAHVDTEAHGTVTRAAAATGQISSQLRGLQV